MTNYRYCSDDDIIDCSDDSWLAEQVRITASPAAIPLTCVICGDTVGSDNIVYHDGMAHHDQCLEAAFDRIALGYYEADNFGVY